jgi:hypothetical protein
MKFEPPYVGCYNLKPALAKRIVLVTPPELLGDI